MDEVALNLLTGRRGGLPEALAEQTSPPLPFAGGAPVCSHFYSGRMKGKATRGKYLQMHVGKRGKLDQLPTDVPRWHRASTCEDILLTIVQVKVYTD